MIELCDVTIESGPFRLQHLNLQIPQGQCAVLMGGTGQGKTTLLEAICGLRPVSSGRVIVDGADVTHCRPGDRGIGYVPQDLALFPTMSVYQHLEFALRIRRWHQARRQSRVQEVAAMLEIEPLLDRAVTHLSGGEAQRVALGRALAFSPRVLLLDEPLAALDEATRARLAKSLHRIQRSTGITLLHVTHNQAEAAELADLRYVIADRQLRLEQPSR